MGIKNPTIIHNTHDPLFGGMVPNPTKINIIKDSSLVKENHYDIAISTDSDCDRLGIEAKKVISLKILPHQILWIKLLKN